MMDDYVIVHALFVTPSPFAANSRIGQTPAPDLRVVCAIWEADGWVAKTYDEHYRCMLRSICAKMTALGEPARGAVSQAAGRALVDFATLVERCS